MASVKVSQTWVIQHGATKLTVPDTLVKTIDGQDCLKLAWTNKVIIKLIADGVENVPDNASLAGCRAVSMLQDLRNAASGLCKTECNAQVSALMDDGDIQPVVNKARRGKAKPQLRPDDDDDAENQQLISFEVEGYGEVVAKKARMGHEVLVIPMTQDMIAKVFKIFKDTGVALQSKKHRDYVRSGIWVGGKPSKRRRTGECLEDDADGGEMCEGM
jgi:hypothetical protein